ncbi:dTDP-4-dehydrorhamnose reductase [Alistipes sp.]|uniref:dTDP-4-dehydrorhamnose reductase n=1 Tax=Alistipes sp. TaxID=1872444 RepID=UPI0025C29421|nr:dTDP-4-dehydrorhamnose reductase [Alistipes sp.]MCI7140270.1 dTDP-4-dehydrorhamnose reductase [Alistipes sp.]
MPDKRILVTGCNGQLGRELQRLGAISPLTYLFTDIADLDITDRQAVCEYVARERVDVIVNCAAYTDVDGAEEDEATAERVNAEAVRNLAEAMRIADGTLFHISTDYVFGGEGNTPFTEDMPVNPLGAYGRTKRHGEKAIAESGCKALIIRTAWLYSEWGRNFLKTMLRLTGEQEALQIVFDQVGTPTFAGDLALAIFSIIEKNLYSGNEGTYHFSNEGVCSWYDFAVEIAEAAGHDRCRILPCHSEEFPSKVRRPAYSVLDKSKIKRTFALEIPHWRDSMRYCIARIMKAQE